MQIGLFIPCYVDQLYPQVGMATVKVLEQIGASVEFPNQQTCCGQPMANSGCNEEARPLAENFLKIFRDYEYVVAPSGSCVAMIRHHYEEFLQGHDGFDALKSKTFELCEFLTDVAKVDIDGEFPFQVGVHQSCHGLRELRMGKSSERVEPAFNKVRSVLQNLNGIQFVEPNRPDECCGFGGTFAVAEEAVSCVMGNDRLDDHQQAGADVLTAADMSCLMHLQGLVRRQKRPLKIMHVAQILAGEKP